MAYKMIADVAMVMHLAFLVYLVVGGFIAWRLRWTIWLHLVTVGWGFGTVLFGLECPLTQVENWARRSAGEQGLDPTGFIDHYLTGVVYPQEAQGLVRLLAGLVVVASWVGFMLRSRSQDVPRSRSPKGEPAI